ncbi:putative calcium-transporting atpase 13, plasma membrane-type [Nicotiana attenuata]|uniref:Calcium-transporting atpase 13, plasma membrane-type n=1 Tax=Nicotiana attenuata TaxID=49451 RepID=A0A314KIY5_NICAT|nr:putative calcium-transporting atpase 13, plasma membrane-type [Nicotiana attenuata]
MINSDLSTHIDEENVSNFSISAKQLAHIVENNSNNKGKFLCQNTFVIEHLFNALETNTDSGILGDSNDLYRRRKAFGSNTKSEGRSPSSITKGFDQLILEAFKDTTVILLLCCAALSLVIGIKMNGLQEGLFDVLLIFLPIMIVVNFGVTYRFFKAIWMKKKMAKQKKVVRVLRHHQMLQIPVSQVVVGDILSLETGNEVPADGILIHGNSFKLDDGLTDEHFSQHPSLFAGTCLVEGSCQFLVTAVGKNTERCKLMELVASSQHDCMSKLHRSIDEMSSFLEKLWLSLSLLILIVQVFRCFLWKSRCCDKDRNPDPKGVKNTVEEIMNEATKYMRRNRGGTNNKVNGLVAMLCILLFSLKDGLSLGIFIILLYASKEMKKAHQTIVHKLPACANVALVTTLCLGKTLDLVVKHKMMADLWIGFEKILNLPADCGGAEDSVEEVLNTLLEGICMNITGGVSDDSLLIWAEKVLGGDIDELHGSCTILSRDNLYPSKGLCGLLIKRNKEDGEFMHVHWKGEPKLVLSMCSHYYDINGTMQTLDDGKREMFDRNIESIISNGVHCFGFAYKKVKTKQEKENYPVDSEENTSIAKDGLSLLGIVVLKNPYSPELRQTIEICRESGVEIKLMVDEDLYTARLMALNSGILKVEEDIEGAIIEAAEFRSSSKEAQISMSHKIKVLANTTPADKLLLVHYLRAKNRELVAATGTCIRDLPYLKEADVGIFIGENCADLAKEDADITVVDSNFGMIPAILILGRYVCTNIEKFIQLQLILNISAFTTSFILLIFNPTSEEQLTPFQLLWVNIIMEVLGALFLAIITSAVKPESLEFHQVMMNCSKPTTTNYGTGAPIITKNMLMNIAVQSMFQVTLLLILSVKGRVIFRLDETLLSTMIFNSYVLCQAFVLIISAIEITKTSIFKGNIRRNPWRKCLFIASVVIVGIIVALQVILIQIMSKIAHWKKLGMKQWSISIGTAALSLPIHYAAKLVSNSFQSFLIMCVRM